MFSGLEVRELVPARPRPRLQAVAGLRRRALRGRPRRSPHVKHVVRFDRPRKLSPTLRNGAHSRRWVYLQRFTGIVPARSAIMRACDIDMSDPSDLSSAPLPQRPSTTGRLGLVCPGTQGRRRSFLHPHYHQRRSSVKCVYKKLADTSAARRRHFDIAASTWCTIFRMPRQKGSGHEWRRWSVMGQRLKTATDNRRRQQSRLAKAAGVPYDR